MFFRTAKRNIFIFHDGTKKRRVDPLPIWRALWSHERQLQQALTIRADENPKLDPKWKDEAFDDIVTITRDVFKIKPYDGTTRKGLTEDETESVLLYYFGFMDALKKNTGTPPSESQSSDSNGLENESTTPPESDFTSMNKSSRSDEPESISMP